MYFTHFASLSVATTSSKIQASHLELRKIYKGTMVKCKNRKRHACMLAEVHNVLEIMHFYCKFHLLWCHCI